MQRRVVYGARSLRVARPLCSSAQLNLISSSAQFTTLTTHGTATPWVPGNPSSPEQAGATRETLYEVMYPGHVAVTEEIARAASVHAVVQGLYAVAARQGRLPPGQEEKVKTKWSAAVQRLEQERGVTTLADLAALNRVAWWRTRIPPALRSALNTYIYHQRLPASALP
jgi:hypothetical protein